MLLLTEFYQTLQFLQGEFFLRKNSIGLYLLNTHTQTHTHKQQKKKLLPSVQMTVLEKKKKLNTVKLYSC